mgnify:CR=1 FL=1
MRRRIEDIQIPDNVDRWANEHNGVNIAVNYNFVDGESGYAHMLFRSVVISQITRHCNRCGYDPLWNPDDSNSKCLRHTYSTWRYDDVFAWTDNANPLSLEECFDLWLSQQPTEHEWDKPAKEMTFGQFGWR